MSVTLSPEQVTSKYGRLFCRGVYTLVDERNGVARIIEECSAKGPVEWDLANRKRAGGAITDIRIEGTTLIMDTIIGEREVHFGPASRELGGQGLRSLVVDGERVKTTWVGIAGASVGIGACMPQGPGTIEACYPEDSNVGGANRIEVTVTTPKMIRVIFAVDDTDTKEKGASWVLMLKCAQSCPIGHFMEHKIIQLNPNTPDRTTQCVAVGASFAVQEKDVGALRDYVTEFVRENTLSKHTALAMFKGLMIPKVLEDYGLEAKKRVLTIDDAKAAAEAGGVEVIEITGRRGMIGAVAGIGCFDMGLRAAMIPEDWEHQ